MNHYSALQKQNAVYAASCLKSGQLLPFGFGSIVILFLQTWITCSHVILIVECRNRVHKNMHRLIEINAQHACLVEKRSSN